VQQILLMAEESVTGKGFYNMPPVLAGFFPEEVLEIEGQRFQWNSAIRQSDLTQVEVGVLGLLQERWSERYVSAGPLTLSYGGPRHRDSLSSDRVRCGARLTNLRYGISYLKRPRLH